MLKNGEISDGMDEDQGKVYIGITILANKNNTHSQSLTKHEQGRK